MLEVVGTVAKDKDIIGYQLFDGKDRFMVTVMQLWKTAKQQCVKNIEAAGTEENPIIKGKLGIDLRVLPKTDYSTV